MLLVALGVMLGYAIQFYVPIQIMMPTIRKTFKFVDRHPLHGEVLFRSFMVLITFAVAALVPNLGLLLSLFGAVFSTIIALVMPALIQLVILSSEEGGLSWFVIIKDSIILLIAFLGLITGGYESLSQIIKAHF